VPIQFVLDKWGAKKFEWLKAYALGFSLAGGLFAAAFVGAM